MVRFLEGSVDGPLRARETQIRKNPEPGRVRTLAQYVSLENCQLNGSFRVMLRFYGVGSCLPRIYLQSPNVEAKLG